MPSSRHILFSAAPAWGHIRAFCTFAARLIKEHDDIVITMILSPNYVDQATLEVAAELQDFARCMDVSERIRIFSPFESLETTPFDLVIPFAASFPEVYKALLGSDPIKCAATGKIFKAAPPPQVIMLDFLAFFFLPIIRKISGNTVPVLAWVSGHISFFLRHYGPPHLGGHGDLSALAAEEDKSKLGVMGEDKLAQMAKGDIIKVPGVPPLFDYEFFPQILPFTMPNGTIVEGVRSFIRDSDGAILISAYAFEGEPINAVKTWFKESKKDIFVIGPLHPSKLKGKPKDGKSNEIIVFLEDMLRKRGKHSVILMSFGTLFWPSDGSYVEEVISAFLEKETPFILAYASPYAKLPEDLIQRIKLSGIGLLAKWCPQKDILQHPATGWFLTHCGQSSTLEALDHGIPMITWPFEADQPLASLYLSETLCVAFELLQVRTGSNGMKPLLRNGKAATGTREAIGIEIRDVLDACHGEKGQVLRRNVEAIKKRFVDAWSPDGVSRRETLALLEKYLPN